jgi:hypothetical protein
MVVATTCLATAAIHIIDATEVHSWNAVCSQNALSSLWGYTGVHLIKRCIHKMQFMIMPARRQVFVWGVGRGCFSNDKIDNRLLHENIDEGICAS